MNLFDAETNEGKRALLSLALTTARAAGTLVHAAWRKHPVVEHKGVIDLVTEYDRESERFIHERLTSETPFSFVGEEQGGHPNPEKNIYTWYVDPIDGTTNFVHGHPFYCVSIGLFAGTRPILGAVVAPALATEWTGIVGTAGAAEASALRNGGSCVVSDVTALGQALLATGFPYDRKTSEDNNFDAFVAIKKKAQAVRRCGSARSTYCLVADGTYDGYWERKLKPWDLAAGAAIVMAARGRVSDFQGAHTNVIAGNLIATNGKIHEALLAELSAVPAMAKAIAGDAGGRTRTR